MLQILLATLLGGLSLLYLLRRFRSSTSTTSDKSVALVVLGDIGRSPRMLYHAQSFVSAGYKIHIVAYRGSNPPKQLADNPNLHFVYLPTPLGWISRLPRPLFLLFAPFKVVVGAFDLLRALVWTLDTPPSYIFLQNPPAIPTLPVVQLAAFLRGNKVIIDWHNTGYSMLALRLGPHHPVVKLARFIEHHFGRSAYAHLCVSDAMKAQLQQEAKLHGRVLTFHDRPPSSFRRLDESESHELFSRLPVLSSISFPSSSSTADSTSSHPLSPTLFTFPSGTLLPSRPALLVSATSWTADEDFSILLRALSIYEAAARACACANGEGGVPRPPGGGAQKGEGEGGKLPRVVVIITGKGAGKEAFEREVKELEKGWEWVRVRTAWLAIEDYPRLLGSADLGISLHTSTSGIDLPMKVVDMFGCELPALALDFPCLNELVKDGKNGRVFRTAEDLADQMIDLLRNFPRPFPSPIDTLCAGIKQVSYGVSANGEKWGSWEENWDRIVRPLLV